MNMWLKRMAIIPGFLLAVTVALGDGNRKTESNLSAQSAAEVIRKVAGTDGAFLAAGLVKDGSFHDDLSQMLEFPSDSIVVVNLTGAQLKQAFERSVSLYPQPNASFLQISGFDVTFSKSAEVNSRILTIKMNDSTVEMSHTYTIAMPASLGRGGLGYFKIWDKSKISKTIEGSTVESVLKGKGFMESSPHWVARD
jgi:2',3'-cyclic-nucleotide 2'-phosphodiesterase (5'-nucleotidase family)